MKTTDRIVRVWSRAAFALALATASTGLLSGSAEACSVFPAGLTARTVWPSTDARVPTNGRLLVSYASAFDDQITDLGDDLTLLDAAGTEVPVSRTRAGADILVVPKAALLPGQSYRLADRRRLPCTVSAHDCGATSALLEFAAFTTTSGADTTPPTFAGLTSAKAGDLYTCHGGGCCSDHEEVPITFWWTNATDDVAGADLRYNVYRQDGAKVVPVARFQNTDFPFTGVQTCSGERAPLQLVPGSYLVRAVDYAGNEDPNAVTRAVHDECFSDCWICGCAVAAPTPNGSALAGPIAAAIAFALAILLGTRKRARSSS